MPKAGFEITKGHSCIQLRVWGRCKPPVGPGGEGPGSTEDLAFYNIQNRLKKSPVLCILLCIALCFLNTD